MNEIKGNLTKNQYDELKEYSGANIMVIDGDNQNVSSSGTISGEFSGTWHVEYDTSGFTGKSFVVNNVDFSDDYRDGTLQEAFDEYGSSAYFVVMAIGTTYFGCVTIEN